jgi:hypothetical protein
LNRKHWSLAILTALAISFSTGCGSTTISASNSPGGQTNPPTQSLLTVSGQYDLVLTSTSGRGTTTVYTNFAQTGGTFTGAPNTLVCPSNNLSQCKGLDFPVASITPSGTISGKDVTIAISFPATVGTDTVTMAGSATGTSLAGTFSDSLGDSGTWTASTAIRPIPSFPAVYDYTGTFNSASDPLVISPTIHLELGRETNVNSNFVVQARATILNSLCISSLALSGQAIGDALTLTDTASKASIIALPILPAANSFTFNYSFESTAPSCAGDFGSGQLTIDPQPWDY